MGGWLFRWRGLVPVPLLVAELAIGTPSLARWSLAWLPVVAGLGLRAWGVGHLGSRSRTRAPSSWELVDTGPFARCRNPLYVANGLLWLGVGLVCGPGWVGAWAVLLVAHYPLVVAWEEQHLRDDLGEAYVRYVADVPRWLPLGRGAPGAWSAAEVWLGERSTWLAVLVVMGLLIGLSSTG